MRTRLGLFERRANQRQQAAQVIARRELGHHAAECSVQINLAPQLMSQQSALLIEHGDRAFVTGSLDGQDAHIR
jgi:hypothetical protein